MEEFDGYLFSKLAAIGTKSEGPVYFLQQSNYNEIIIKKKAMLFENDSTLHALLGKLVKVKGEIHINEIDYAEISELDLKNNIILKEGLKLELELGTDELLIDKKPGNPQTTIYLALSLLVQWPHKSIWHGTCPTSQIYDFIIKYNDEIIWRWSDNKAFTFMITPVQLSGGAFHRFKEVWAIDPEIIQCSGSYEATAMFIASGQQVSKKFDLKISN